MVEEEVEGDRCEVLLLVVDTEMGARFALEVVMVVVDG